MIPFDPYEKPINDMMLVCFALQAMQRLSPLAQKYFQCGGKYHKLSDWGDDVVVSSYKRMLRFCEANEAAFKRFE